MAEMTEQDVMLIKQYNNDMSKIYFDDTGGIVVWSRKKVRGKDKQNPEIRNKLFKKVYTRNQDINDARNNLIKIMEGEDGFIVDFILNKRITGDFDPEVATDIWLKIHFDLADKTKRVGVSYEVYRFLMSQGYKACDISDISHRMYRDAFEFEFKDKMPPNPSYYLDITDDYHVIKCDLTDPAYNAEFYVENNSFVIKIGDQKEVHTRTTLERSIKLTLFELLPIDFLSQHDVTVIMHVMRNQHLSSGN